MIKAVKASRSHAKETRKGCRKREKTIGGDGEGPSETKSRPLKYGYVSILGRKRVMEDPVMVVPPRKLPGGYSFFAAYGGRGRAKVAEMCTDKLHHCLEKHTETAAKVPEEKGLHWGKLVMDCFSCMYEDMSGKEVAESEGRSAAAAAAAERMMKFTAVVVGVEKGEVVLVNCGGSRAVLWSGGVASPLWNEYDHKPDEADEESVEAAGGTIISRNDDGLVSTLRSQGDECLKHERISEAEVTVMRRNENCEDFLIIASDGLWNVVGKEMACEVVRKCLGSKIRRLPSEGGGASQAAAMLAELAIAKGSKDNISIIVVHLNSIN